LTGHFSPIIPPFANRGISRRFTWSASGDERGTKARLSTISLGRLQKEEEEKEEEEKEEEEEEEEEKEDIC
jgi:hypothetical protein